MSFIQKKHDVEESGLTRVFSRGETREDYADAWAGTGNVILVGLPGAGKATLARGIAEASGKDVCEPETVDQALAALARSGGIVVLADDLVREEAVRSVLHGAGKVLYLLRDARSLAESVFRDGDDFDALWQGTAERLERMEPVFYSVLHFIIQPESPDEMLQSALEKISF